MTIRKLSNASAVDVLAFHRSLLRDEVRTHSYRDAINAAVRPNDVVVDLGCGSGILSFFACRAGAKRVYAIDELPVIELARELAHDNGFEDRIVFVNRSSFEVAIEEPVDVIVTETMGNNGFDEQIARAVAHAKRVWLRDGGTIVPRVVAMYAAPVEDPTIEVEAAFWQSMPFGIDMNRLRTHAVNSFYTLNINPDALLGDAAELITLNLGDDAPSLRGASDVTITRDGTLHGIAAWFRADLIDGITISNAPPNACVSWKQSFFPLAKPVRVRRGDVIQIEMQTFDGLEWRWRAGDFEQSTLYGFPFSRPL
ncbi:MAG: type protein arginine methyltransferase [Acidobacteriota bacterium]|jgi:protein arginine N-methyltransferase 1|nr:type protein arginine methyltransferase [Acidobacteriota bacterium]